MIAKTPQNVDEISGRRLDRGVTYRLLPYLKPHVVRASIATAMVFIYAGIAMYGPRLLGKIVDKALLPRDQRLLLQLVALYACLELARVLCYFIQSYQLQLVGQRADMVRRARCGDRIRPFVVQ